MDNIINNERPMKWYNACKIITLVLGILGCIGIAFAILFTVLMSVASVMPDTGDEAIIFNSMQTLYVGCIILYIIFTTVFFVAFHGLKNYKKTALYMMYVLNIGLPLACLITIPLMNSYFEAFSVYLFATGGASTTEAGQMESLMKFISSGIMIIYALITGGALIPNTIYFNKRKDLLK